MKFQFLGIYMRSYFANFLGLLLIAIAALILYGRFYLAPTKNFPEDPSTILYNKAEESSRYHAMRIYDADYNGLITAGEITKTKAFRNNPHYRETYQLIESLNIYDRRFIDGLQLAEARLTLKAFKRPERIRILEKYDHKDRVKIIRDRIATKN